MTDPATLMTIAASALAGLSIVSLATLKGWHGWLALRHAQLGGGSRIGGMDEGGPSPAARIELADLRERIRKLEAIAAGVDL